MQIRLHPDDWRKRKLFVATPMFGGNCSGHFTESMIELQKLCTALHVDMQRLFLFNESLLPRARNWCAASFLNSDATHLIFIDADTGFAAADIITMLGLMGDESGYDVLAGSCPSKEIAWERVRSAAAAGQQDLARAGSKFVVNFKPGTTDIKANEPVEVQFAGTGVMMIKRTVFDRIRQRFPDASYIPDQAMAGHAPGTPVHMYFQADIDPASRRYLSEDFWFCQRVHEVGGKIWICPWMGFSHIGTYSFTGSLADFAKR